MKKLVKCKTISIDCIENDPVDIKAGGPEHLGFDFFVKESDTNEMVGFIYLTLDEYKLPVKRVYFSGTRMLEEKDVWTKERIASCIKEESETILEEERRKFQIMFK